MRLSRKNALSLKSTGPTTLPGSQPTTGLTCKPPTSFVHLPPSGRCREPETEIRCQIVSIGPLALSEDQCSAKAQAAEGRSLASTCPPFCRAAKLAVFPHSRRRGGCHAMPALCQPLAHLPLSERQSRQDIFATRDAGDGNRFLHSYHALFADFFGADAGCG
jgi:hypothetical protein